MRKCITCGKKYDNSDEKICPVCGGMTRAVISKNKLINIITIIALVAVTALITAVAIINANKPDTATVNNGPLYQDARFEKFETALIGKKLPYTKIIKKDHTEVGAKEGYGYKFGNSLVVELYVYDESSEIYSSSVKVNHIPMLTLGNKIPVRFNGTICLYMNNYQHEYSDEILEIFKNLK